MKTFRIKGIDKVIDNINERMKTAEKQITKRGFIKFAMAVRNEMEYGARKIPEDTGNLRASWFVTVKGEDSKNLSNVGFSQGKGQESLRSAKDTAIQQSVVANAKSIVKASKHPLMVFGFSANYAAAVHEMLDPDIEWKRSGSGPKYFEMGLKSKQDDAINILSEEVNLKK